MATAQPIQVTLSKGVAVGLAIAAAVGFLSGGFTLGVVATHGFQTSTPASPSTTAAPGGGTVGSPDTTTPSGGPFTTGATFNFKTPVENLAGKTTTLARGSQGTVVMAMASWCLFCAYEDKYVMPQLAKTPGVAIDIVDVSPQGGIGNPGPESPAFSGHDGTGGSLNTAGMIAIMTQYTKTFGTLNAANIHVYVAPSKTRTAWNVQSFPTLAFIGAHGKIAVVPPGAQTVVQAQSDLHQAMGG